MHVIIRHLSLTESHQRQLSILCKNVAWSPWGVEFVQLYCVSEFAAKVVNMHVVSMPDLNFVTELTFKVHNIQANCVTLNTDFQSHDFGLKTKAKAKE